MAMKMRSARRRFGRFKLDVEGLRLFRDGRPVKIQPQPLRMLVTLTDLPGEIVTRDELRNRIWGDATFVEFDQGLGYCVRQIRLVLDDDAARPFYIETIKGRGYRFIAPVIDESRRDVTTTAEAPFAPETDAAIASPRAESRKVGTEGHGVQRSVAVAAAAIAVIGLAGAGWFAWSREATAPGLHAGDELHRCCRDAGHLARRQYDRVHS